MCRRMVNMICMYNHPARLPVRYPLFFNIYAGAVFIMSVGWIFNFFLNVIPSLEQEGIVTVECNLSMSQLKYNAKVLFIYFAWFIIAKSCLFLPCVVARIGRVQSQTHGFCKTYFVHLLLKDGPIYIFVVGSVLFWFNILRSAECEQRQLALYETLKMYAVFSCSVAFACVILSHWHNKLVSVALELLASAPPPPKGAPPGTVTKLETQQHNLDDFGDDKKYPSECVICLVAWEPEDTIKVTPCGHAFHEHCIEAWLKSARTCAMCRQDLVELTSKTQEQSTQVI